MRDLILNCLVKGKKVFERKRAVRKWRKLQDMGLRIGKDVYLPTDTWIDASHCYLISIGDRVRFGPHCAILAHDAFMNEFLDASKIGRVTIHESCTIGFGSLILPGVEIGSRSIIGAHSVVSTNVPAGSFVVGNPAKVVGQADKFIRYHRSLTNRLPLFPYDEYGSENLSKSKREELLKELGSAANAMGYITGGYSLLRETHELFSGRNK